MPELDDDEREYLAAFVAVATPAAPEVQASLARVQERIAAGDAPAIDPPEEEPQADEPSRSKPWVMMGVATLAIAAAIALLFRLDVATRLAGESTAPAPSDAAYAEHERDEAGGRAVPREPAPRTRSTAPAPAPLEEASEPEPAVEPEPEPAPTVDEPARRRRPRPTQATDSKATEPKPAEPATDATLHAEIALLRPAQKALRAGDHARALRLLDDHAKSFPRSVLAPERTLGRIQALCGLDRRTQAQSAIDAFIRRNPGSPLTGRIKKACPAPEASP